MGIEERLRRLEANRRAAEGYEIPPRTLLLLRHLDNARREMDGLEPVPLTPEEERLSVERDARLLEEGIPAIRANPGWREERAQRLLDSWERDIRERLDEAARKQTEGRNQ